MLYLRVEDDGIGNLSAALHRLGPIPPDDLLDLGYRLADIIIEDTRKGVLEGKDWQGQDFPPLSYRHGSGTPTQARGRTNNDVFGTTTRRYKGLTDYQGKAGQLPSLGILANNNLTTEFYQTFDGPRLAPRRESSRVIANQVKLAPEVHGQTVVAQCEWFDVVDENGEPFLIRHFTGNGVPLYDLRGVREWGIQEANRSILEWVQALITPIASR
jgi:hypothetical protein